MKYVPRTTHMICCLILALAVTVPSLANEVPVHDGERVVYAEGIHLDDAAGTGAEGGARVARNSDDTQGFWCFAAGLSPEMPYTLIVDGFLAASPSANAEGRIRVGLVSVSDEHPLPADMQPIEDIRVVELLDGDGATVLAGLFTGEPTTHVAIRGHVGAIGADSFELIHGDNTASVLVDGDTSWRGGLEGLDDLTTDMPVSVAGSWAGDGVLQAFVVGPAERPQPIRIGGEIGEVTGSGFSLNGRDNTITVNVDGQTEWHGDLTGLADLAPGMKILVIGLWNAEGSFNAFAVRTDDRPQHHQIHGDVTEIFGDGFVLTAGDASARVFTSDETQWLGGLTGLDGLELGQKLMASGAWNDDGSFNAMAVGPARRPEPMRLHGQVSDIGDNGFSLVHGDHTAQFLVDDATEWHGGLEGLDDLEVAMEVAVVAAPGPDGAFMALMVAPAQIDRPIRVFGDVTAVFPDGFTLGFPDREISIVVDDATAWRGDLTGLADVEVGMRLEVNGLPNDDGSILAVLVNNENRPPMIRINGAIIEVGADGFSLGTADQTVAVVVGDQTQWHGDLSGLGDLAAGMEVTVHGVPTDDGRFIAAAVGPIHP